jgi:hypothetical protein
MWIQISITPTDKDEPEAAKRMVDEVAKLTDFLHPDAWKTIWPAILENRTAGFCDGDTKDGGTKIGVHACAQNVEQTLKNLHTAEKVFEILHS